MIILLVLQHLNFAVYAKIQILLLDAFNSAVGPKLNFSWLSLKCIFRGILISWFFEVDRDINIHDKVLYGDFTLELYGNKSFAANVCGNYFRGQKLSRFWFFWTNFVEKNFREKQKFFRRGKSFREFCVTMHCKLISKQL